MKQKFTIRSTELRNYVSKHNCTVIRHVNGNKLLISIEPPFPGYVYDSVNDYTQFVLAPRFADSELVPEISEWPFRVHICIPEREGEWNNGPYKNLDWGIIEKIE